MVDHRHHLLGVVGAASDVRTALIPAEALDGEVVQRVDHAVVENLDGRHAALPLARGERRGVEIPEMFLQLGREPRLDPRAAAAAVDDPHGHAERPAQVAPEEVADGAEGLHRGGRSLAPGARHVLARREAAVDLHREEPHVGILRALGDDLERVFDRAVASALHGNLHVRLSRAEPHLADQHVAQHDRFAVAVADADRAFLERRRRRAQRRAPAAFGVGLRPHGRPPRRGHPHLRTRGRPAPDLHVRRLLQHHVVAHDGREPDFRPGRRPCRREQHGKQ